MNKPSLFSEYVRFLRQEKKYWMIPVVILFILIGTLVVVLESSALAPFIYSIF